MSQSTTEGRDPQTHAIIGAAMEVHGHLGPGFLEAVYHESLCLEIAARGIPFAPKVKLPVYYKGQQLSCYYEADIICYDRVIVEVKALRAITSIEEAQLLNYLKATKMEIGLILNFGASSLQFKRMAFSNSRKLAAPPAEPPPPARA